MKFLKYILAIFLTLNLYAQEIKELKPNYIFEATGGVTNLVIQNNLLQ